MPRMNESVPAARPCRDLAAMLCVAACVAAYPASAAAQSTQGPSSSRPPYLVPTAPAGVVHGITSIVTATDLVQRTGAPAGTNYECAGKPDGLGAFDNGNGTITVLMNHEIDATLGAVRAHGARGAFVEALIVDKTTLAVVSSADLIASVIDAAGAVHDAAHGNAIAFHRFCSGDLPPVSAFFNAASGRGTQERLWLHGEEGSSGGLAQATVATGALRGTSYTLAQMNLSTNGSGLVGVGAYENLLACPFAQDLTVLIGDNDGGSGIMSHALAVYVGTKQSSGTPVARAGLTNGTLTFVSVAGNPTEIVNSTTRATNIASGTRFALSSTASTAFSKPEDGAWNPANPRQYFFVSSDRLDNNTSTGPNPTIGATGATAQTGKSRLWRLTFDDITNPSLGGVIDLLIDGSKGGQKVNMLDNVGVDADGRVWLDEDPGSTTYVGKVWVYDPATDTLVQVAKFDPALWGELAAVGGTPGAIAPHTNSKETSGVVDVTALLAGPGERALLLDVQDHSSDPLLATPTSVEGGQLLLLRIAIDASAVPFGTGCGAAALSLAAAPGELPRMGSTFHSDIGNIPAGHVALMAIGFSDTVLGGAPLPRSLAVLGLPQCFLYHDAAFGFLFATTPVAPGFARHRAQVPAGPTLVGLPVFLQAWSSDGSTFAVSNALRL